MNELASPAVRYRSPGRCLHRCERRLRRGLCGLDFARGGCAAIHGAFGRDGGCLIVSHARSPCRALLLPVGTRRFTGWHFTRPPAVNSCATPSSRGFWTEGRNLRPSSGRARAASPPAEIACFSLITASSKSHPTSALADRPIASASVHKRLCAIHSKLQGETESASAQPGTEPAAPMRAAQYARNALPRVIKIGEIWRFFALFRRFSGNQGKADHVSADPARLARSSPGLRSTAQRQHQPHRTPTGYPRQS